MTEGGSSRPLAKLRPLHLGRVILVVEFSGGSEGVTKNPGWLDAEWAPVARSSVEKGRSRRQGKRRPLPLLESLSIKRKIQWLLQLPKIVSM